MSIWTDIHKRSNGITLKQEDIIFEEMVYSRERKTDIIAHNIYNGVEYFVVNYGHHPAGYIACDKSFLDKYTTDWGDINVIDVHGGVTYTGNLYNLTAIAKEGELYGFGWDYAHAGEWAGYLNDFVNEGHMKYDTWMIVEECKSAIDQYLEIWKKDQPQKVQDVYSPLSGQLRVCGSMLQDSTSFAPVTTISEMNEKLQIHTMK